MIIFQNISIIIYYNVNYIYQVIMYFKFNSGIYIQNKLRKTDFEKSFITGAIKGTFNTKIHGCTF